MSKTTKAGVKARNTIEANVAKQKEKRLSALEACKRRKSDGVLVCPPRYATGFGFDKIYGLD